MPKKDSFKKFKNVFTPKKTGFGKIKGDPIVLANRSIISKKIDDRYIKTEDATAPGGSDKEVQFNDDGSFGGDAGFTYDKVTGDLTTTGTTTASNFILGDNENITFGTGGDATIDYNATDLIISPNVAGTGAVRIEHKTTDTTGTNTVFSLKETTTGVSVTNFGLRVEFRMEDSSGTDNIQGTVESRKDGGGDAYGKFVFTNAIAGTQRQWLLVDRLIIDFNAETVRDFRIRSENNTNMFYLDESADKIGINTKTPICELDINGGFAANLTSQTGTYTALTTDHTIICGSGNETFTVTLPSASTVSGIIYNIKNVGTGTITVDGASSETIDGATTAVISSQFACITIQCDGSNWHIL
ncbi:MAG: hypothetical protein IH948_03800 [Bacteroidetes bacterium]|nr:hypothetical protein [Bacteroidota bacterium]